MKLVLLRSRLAVKTSRLFSSSRRQHGLAHAVRICHGEAGGEEICIADLVARATLRLKRNGKKQKMALLVAKTQRNQWVILVCDARKLHRAELEYEGQMRSEGIGRRISYGQTVRLENCLLSAADANRISLRDRDWESIPRTTCSLVPKNNNKTQKEETLAA